MDFFNRTVINQTIKTTGYMLFSSAKHTTVFSLILLALFLFSFFPDIANMPNTIISKSSATIQTQSTKASALRARFQRIETTSTIPDALKGVIEHTDFYGQTFNWYLHEGDLVIDGDFVVDLPLLVHGHLVVSGDLEAKIYQQIPVLVSGDVISQIIYLNDSWLNAGGNVVTRAVILRDRDSAPSVINASGFVYTDLLDTYGDACEPRKIIQSAIQIPGWGTYQNLELLTPEFANHLPVKSDDTDYYDVLEEWIDDDSNRVLLADLLRALKAGKSIHKENIKPPAPAEVQCWLQETDEATLKQLASQNEAFSLRIALRPYPLSEALQQQLSRHSSLNIRRALAVRTDLTHSVLQQMSNDSDDVVKIRISPLLANQHLDLPQRFSANSSDEVRLLYAQSENAVNDFAIAEILAKDPLIKIRLALSSHDRLDFGLLKTLMFADEDLSVRRNAVRTAFRSGQIDQETFLRLIVDSDEKIRAMAAQTKIWMTDSRFDHRLVSEKMLSHSDIAVRSAAASGFIEWPDLAAKIANDSSPEVRKWAARGLFTPPESLLQLAVDDDFDVRSSLVYNPLSTTEALDKLVDRELKTWRNSFSSSNKEGMDRSLFNMKLLRHRAISPEALRKLKEAGIPYFSANTLEEQPNWPADIVIIYVLQSADDDSSIIEKLAIQRIRKKAEQQQKSGWPEPEAILADMLESNVYDLQKFAALSRFTPPDALKKFAERYDTKEDYTYILENIAANPSTPVDILLQWAGHDDFVYHLLKNPQLPLPVLEKIAQIAPTHEEKGVAATQTDDEVEQMPTIVFGQEAQSLYAKEAQVLLKALKSRRENISVDVN